MQMQDSLSFPDTKPGESVHPVFAPDTRHPGVIHARVLYLLEHGLVEEVFELVDSRADDVQASTYQLLTTHPATRHLYV